MIIDKNPYWYSSLLVLITLCIWPGRDELMSSHDLGFGGPIWMSRFLKSKEVHTEKQHMQKSCLKKMLYNPFIAVSQLSSIIEISASYFLVNTPKPLICQSLKLFVLALTLFICLFWFNIGQRGTSDIHQQVLHRGVGCRL